MKWIPVTHGRPHMREDWPMWPASLKVLALDSHGVPHIATYEQPDEDEPPRWYTDGERWELDDVAYWMPIPPLPEAML